MMTDKEHAELVRKITDDGLTQKLLRMRIAVIEWNRLNPPHKEIKHGQFTIGVWKDDVGYTYGIKSKIGYVPSELMQLPNILVSTLVELHNGRQTPKIVTLSNTSSQS